MLQEEDLAALKQRRLYSEYKRALREGKRRIEAEFREEADILRRRKRKGLDDDHDHRRALNLCIDPFYKVTAKPWKLGYHFNRASPLSEPGLEVKNMDFLIVNYGERRHIAIFGEAKGSVGNPSRIVRETLERKKVVLKHKDYIKKEYLKIVDKKTPVYLEFVLGVPVESNNRICRAIEEEGGGLIPWAFGGFGGMCLSVDMPHSIGEDTRRKMKHRDRELNNALRECRSSESCFSIFPQCHGTAKIQILIEVSKNLSVNLQDLRERVESDLFYLDTAECQAVVDEILQRGMDIGFIKRLDSNRYRIKSPFRKPRDIAEDMKDKWIEHSVNAAYSSRLRKSEQEIDARFLREARMQKTLEEYPEKNLQPTKKPS